MEAQELYNQLEFDFPKVKFFVGTAAELDYTFGEIEVRVNAEPYGKLHKIGVSVRTPGSNYIIRMLEGSQIYLYTYGSNGDNAPGALVIHTGFARFFDVPSGAYELRFNPPTRERIIAARIQHALEDRDVKSLVHALESPLTSFERENFLSALQDAYAANELGSLFNK